MAIPKLPAFFDMYYTEKDGHLARDAYIYNDQLFQTLNLVELLLNHLSTTTIGVNDVQFNGLNPPSKTTAEITALEPDVVVGTLWYNSSLKKLQFKADDGVIETITSS